MDSQQFQRTVLYELAYLHAIVAQHQDFAMQITAGNKMTPEQKKLVADTVAQKQQLLFRELCQRAGIVDLPGSSGPRG